MNFRGVTALLLWGICLITGNSSHAQCFQVHPQGGQFCTGSTVVLQAVPVSGAVQWYRNNVPLNAFGETLVLTNITSANNGLYKAVIYSNGGFCNGSASQSAGVIANNTLTYLTQPMSVQTCLGARVEFSAQANQSATYQWFRNNVAITGATSSTLEWGPVTLADANATFRCQIVGSSCQGAVPSSVATLTVRHDPAAEIHSSYLTSLTATEIIRGSLLRNENPRLAAVLTAIGVVTALNPNMTTQQLGDFVSQYDSLLRAQHPPDTNLNRPMNFHSAVRFSLPITSITGIDADVGEAVLDRLGLSLGNSTRERNLVNLQSARALRLALSDELATVLMDTFAGKDASGAVNPLVAPAATAYARANNIEPYPAASVARISHPEILRALSYVPSTPEAFEAERAVGFINVRNRISSELNATRSLINSELAQLNAYSAQYPTLQSMLNAAQTPGVLDAARADQAANLVELNRYRTGISFVIAALAQDAQWASQATILREFSNTQIRFADSTVATASTALQGAGTVLAGVGTLFTGPAGVVAGIGSIAAGTGVLLPLVIPEEPGPPSPFQQLAHRVDELRIQLDGVRVAMMNRFDRVDAQLQSLYAEVTGGFDAMAYYFQQQAGDLRGIQRGLAEAQSNMNRFEANLYGMLAGGFLFNFYENMDQGLNYRETYGDYLTYDEFQGYENSFYSAATSHAESELFAGPITGSLPYSGQGLSILNNYPLGYCFNYLRTYPGTRFGLSNLHSLRLTNPTHWALAADAYSQLARESPWYFARVSPARLSGVRVRGDNAQTAMHQARSSTLHESLHNDWASALSYLHFQVASARDAYPDPWHPNLNLWGGTSQNLSYTWPAYGYMDRYARVCTGSVPISILEEAPGGFNSNIVWNMLPSEYKLAAILDPATRGPGRYILSFRMSGADTLTNGTWQLEPNGVVHRAVVDVELWYSSAPPTTCDISSEGSIRLAAPGQPIQRVAVRRFSLTFGPSNHGYTSTPLETFRNRWRATLPGGSTIPVSAIKNVFFESQSTDSVCCAPSYTDRCWTAQTLVDSAPLAAVRGEINNHLRNHQRAFLNQVITALAGGADPEDLRSTAELVTLNARLTDMYLSIGAPESHARSDLIRGVLRGNEMGIDALAALSFYIAQRDAISTTPGATASTTFPNCYAELLGRKNRLRSELEAVLATGEQEFSPFMKWTIGSLSHLSATRFMLARNDQYVVAPGQTLIVPASEGVMANDVMQPEAILRVILVSPPAQGSLLLNNDGGFRYTPPASNPPASVTFSYKLQDTWVPSTGLPSPESAAVTVLIRIAPCDTMIVDHPQAPEFIPGGVAAMKVRAVGDGRLSYIWRRNGEVLTDGPRLFGSQTGTIVIIGLSETDRGIYTCSVIGACGQADSQPAYLGIQACPADFNSDGGIDGGDIESFYAAWSDGHESADVNFDGGIDGGDVETFFAAWEAGGCI
ncbi:MAG: hypothetical protein JNK25_04820 [Phycisphaerae bacterium]|nr:hypothetical protein [Phycisphaerae bacterium]